MALAAIRLLDELRALSAPDLVVLIETISEERGAELEAWDHEAKPADRDDAHRSVFGPNWRPGNA